MDGKQEETKKGTTPTEGEYRCGFCTLTFKTLPGLYQHQRENHDPEELMFSEIGLPK